jgi:hypothetical protein
MRQSLPLSSELSFAGRLAVTGHLNPTLQSAPIPALAAIMGSIVGHLASFAASFFAQCKHTPATCCREMAHREELHSQFIKEAANLYVDFAGSNYGKPRLVYLNVFAVAADRSARIRCC